MSAAVEITNDIALIRMDDGKANAINFEMIAALNTALDKAEADLALSEQGSPSPAKFQLAKGTLLSKQGKKTEADAAFKAAKKIDPTIKLP